MYIQIHNEEDMNVNDMNVIECREFVRKHAPKCCNKKTEVMGYNITNSIQYFVCRVCNERVEIKYWPLGEDDIRDLKLNFLL